MCCHGQNDIQAETHKDSCVGLLVGVNLGESTVGVVLNRSGRHHTGGWMVESEA